jgi:hypothetical protein
VSHPSLGAPPRDETAGHPAAAARLTDDRRRVGRRTLEIVVDGDPTLRERLGEEGLARLLRDTEILIDRLALAIASDDPTAMSEFAEWVVPVYRRRRVPMDDLIRVVEALRQAAANSLPPEARPAADRAVEAAIAAFKRHRRLAGDARRRNKLLEAIYKGA